MASTTTTTAEAASGDNIVVYCRVRPLTADKKGAKKTILRADEATQTIHVGTQSFTFDYAAGPETSQEQVFDVIGKPVTDACLRGFNGCIFAYGQTGSGKTFTIQGVSDGDETVRGGMRGLLPRVLEYLFQRIASGDVTATAGDDADAPSASPTTYTCRASFLEVYNERIYDLSVADSAVHAATAAGTSSLAVRENAVRGTFVDGLTEITVESADAALEVVTNGLRNRRVAATAMNHESSRSHAVFTLRIEAQYRRGGMTHTRSAAFHLIDLAGSERAKLTDAAGDRLREAGQINKSLSALGNVISALVDLSQGKARHIHYRDSKLTMLLRDSLGGNSKTVLIATVSPTEECFPETVSTLKFAARAKLVKNNAVVNEDTTGSVSQMASEIKSLREQLAELRSTAASGLFQSMGGADRATVCEAVLSRWDDVMTSMDITGGSDTPVINVADSVTDMVAAARAAGDRASTVTFAPATAAICLANAYHRLRSVYAGAEGPVSLTLDASSRSYDRICQLEGALTDAITQAAHAISDAEDADAKFVAAQEQITALEAAVENMKPSWPSKMQPQLLRRPTSLHRCPWWPLRQLLRQARRTRLPRRWRHRRHAWRSRRPAPLCGATPLLLGHPPFRHPHAFPA